MADATEDEFCSSDEYGEPEGGQAEGTALEVEEVAVLPDGPDNAEPAAHGKSAGGDGGVRRGEDKLTSVADGGHTSSRVSPESKGMAATTLDVGNPRRKEKDNKKKKGKGGGHTGNPAMSIEDLFVTISTVQVGWYAGHGVTSFNGSLVK